MVVKEAGSLLLEGRMPAAKDNETRLSGNHQEKTD
jgi:hypothetical protein